VTATANDGSVRLTKQGRRRFTARADRLRHEIIPSLMALRDGHDRDDVVQHEYQRATSELARISALLADAQPAETLPDDPDVVELGETVTLRLPGGDLARYVLVHPPEAAAGVDCVSSDSPLGEALLGRRIGDDVYVPAPGGVYRCVIENATRTTEDVAWCDAEAPR